MADVIGVYARVLKSAHRVTLVRVDGNQLCGTQVITAPSEDPARALAELADSVDTLLRAHPALVALRSQNMQMAGRDVVATTARAEGVVLACAGRAGSVVDEVHPNSFASFADGERKAPLAAAKIAETFLAEPPSDADELQAVAAAIVARERR
ncbi:hypothetical protein [Conexibacter woesei]|uniref:hypothetical protein n=1 Tax=Conexibacter woesei TaxID=191495 RepID=UPI00055972FA|nr:hypothetical protein [Conexibacter woesei]